MPAAASTGGLKSFCGLFFLPYDSVNVALSSFPYFDRRDRPVFPQGRFFALWTPQKPRGRIQKLSSHEPPGSMDWSSL